MRGIQRAAFGHRLRLPGGAYCIRATSGEAMDAAEAHREHITRWFYDCSYEVHRGLGEMYVADERFGANYEALAPGLTSYLRDAIVANADRHSK